MLFCVILSIKSSFGVPQLSLNYSIQLIRIRLYKRNETFFSLFQWIQGQRKENVIVHLVYSSERNISLAAWLYIKNCKTLKFEVFGPTMTHQYRPEQNGLNIIQGVIAKEALNYVRRILQSRRQIALSYKQKATADRRKGISIRLYFFDRSNVQNGHNWTPAGSSFNERN